MGSPLGSNLDRIYLMRVLYGKLYSALPLLWVVLKAFHNGFTLIILIINENYIHFRSHLDIVLRKTTELNTGGGASTPTPGHCNCLILKHFQGKSRKYNMVNIVCLLFCLFVCFCLVCLFVSVDVALLLFSFVWKLRMPSRY